MENKSIGKQIVVYVTLAVLLICALFPLYWMVNTSFKSQGEIYNMTPSFWPKNFTWSAYVKLIMEKGFLTNIKNSLLVSLIVAFLSIVVSMLAAYAISKLRFRGRTMISKGILYAYLMPRAVLFIPLYMLVSTIGLNDSIFGLMLIYPTITIPYATWMLISYFKSIPVEIEEAAMIDGCTRARTMLSIIFPLSAPGIAATFIFAFTLCWSEYLYALVVVTKSVDKTITLGLSDMIVGDVFAWGPLMGGSIIASIPVIIMYLFTSKYMVSGMTVGGVK
ncbi:carbohydrate ABC transporter permease [Paenibacillus validus]|uniref:ABC transporter permease subunit n=1 Tax=Paenibacillus validus TaxID=44253 RepID=A0A7X3CT50_9BACL|nr:MULTISPECIES: carbohydrate ABC transporter permease [Paenibacillus]MED4603141.1 carbohydrate ABC transporter permease [Paenibacillus validus]MED4607539.1 carbohydrate ABC transporter permease [Paenibacillus validus]MUG72052.1 ABC transporter permease subunit [Paenibacillus validus]